MMKRALLAAVLFGSCMSAQAALISWFAVLDVAQAGAQPAGTASATASGTGTASGTYDTVTNVLTWSATITGLAGNATLAHFHLGAPGQFRGPVRVELPTLNLGTLAGNRSGQFSGTEDLDSMDFTTANYNDLAALTTTAQKVAALEAELLSGNWYLNIHTSNSPAGEIRGQLKIPEPGTLLLLTLGLVGLAAARRRR